MTPVDLCTAIVHSTGMSRYVLHARSFAGPLSAPTRNELRTAEGDDREALERLADDLREQGFRVWLYERQEAQPGSLNVPGRPRGFLVVREWQEL